MSLPTQATSRDRSEGVEQRLDQANCLCRGRRCTSQFFGCREVAANVKEIRQVGFSLRQHLALGRHFRHLGLVSLYLRLFSDFGQLGFLPALFAPRTKVP
jgi:hypothetical protein